MQLLLFRKESDLYCILFPLELRKKSSIKQADFPSEQLYDSRFKHSRYAKYTEKGSTNKIYQQDTYLNQR